MTAVIAIVGRPNVGKSTLFNRFTQSRDALVANIPGLTRDRQYGHGKFEDTPFIVIDSGGIAENDDELSDRMSGQTQQAIAEADLICFMVDAREGLTAADINIAQNLRTYSKPIFLAVNKIDGLEPNLASADFYRLGIENLHLTTASHGRGTTRLLKTMLQAVGAPTKIDKAEEAGIKFAIIGRPNVGKSTLVNRMLGEERVVTFEQAGTTRDSIFIPFSYKGEDFTIIDTAGIRRRGKVKQVTEKFSIIKTLKAIEQAHIAVMVVDAVDGIVEQDLRLISYIIEAGTGLVIAINKWDGLSQEKKEAVKKELDRRLEFIDFVQFHFISARHGTGVGHIFNSVKQAYEAATISLSTAKLTQILLEATQQHQPPLHRGRRIRLRYAHSGGKNPPIIVIHGKQTEALAKTYKRYLVHYFRRSFNLMGTPIRIEFKTDQNPYLQSDKVHHSNTRRSARSKKTEKK